MSADARERSGDGGDDCERLVFDLAGGEAQDRPALGDEGGVAFAVGLEAVPVAVPAPAVDFDDDARLPPDHVWLVLAEVGVEVWVGQAGGAEVVSQNEFPGRAAGFA